MKERKLIKGGSRRRGLRGEPLHGELRKGDSCAEGEQAVLSEQESGLAPEGRGP